MNGWIIFLIIFLVVVFIIIIVIAITQYHFTLNYIPPVVKNPKQPIPPENPDPIPTQIQINQPYQSLNDILNSRYNYGQELEALDPQGLKKEQYPNYWKNIMLAYG